ncbi:M81 family metallopeptidase [Bradyrhizobium sp. sGM-13]|uniref:M81 family metallopeptidase n=1 Tax=Bradyrhizobium sp. sGM-13 TaxID=2831781 RepID=UPI001BD07AA8|nr:M81 family metallopeptidase [Bradyrhizobium sp. sGM-13]
MAFTILTGEFQHESHSFSRLKADYQSFLNRALYVGNSAVEARGDANTGLAGFLDVARKHGSAVVHSVSAFAEPSGPVTTDAFDRIVGVMVETAKQNRDRIDGVLLALHGAMVTDSMEDGGGEMLERLREVLGPKVPIAITLDLHANVTERMCELADIVVSFKTYPHVDMREVARQVAEILHRTMAGQITPKTICVHVPMLAETNGCRTDIGPMIDWVAKARAYERERGVYAVSINSGFALADINEVGPTVLVTAEGDMDCHRDFARSIAKEIWEQRRLVLNRLYSIAEAVEIARGYPKSTGPLVIAESSDNPGGGAYGDATELLRAMLQDNLDETCYGPMVDAEVAAELHCHQPGDHVEIMLGGKTDPSFGGPPLRLSGTLVGLFDGRFRGDGPMVGGLELSFGPSAVVRADGLSVLVVTYPIQMLDLQQFRAIGIDPAKHRVVALKSKQHFRAAFAPIAGKIIVCDGTGLTTKKLNRFPYRNVPRPIYPIDSDTTFQA